MIVVFPVPPAPIKRHACCVRFRKGVWFSSSRNATSIASANHLQANNCSGTNLNPVEDFSNAATFRAIAADGLLRLQHLATTSLTHSFCNYYQSFRSQLRSGTPHWTHELAVGVRHATLNSHNRSWGPARHTELAESQLRSGTQHWTHEITVGVRHATLNSQDRGWGPARHTALAGSRLGSSTPHWTHRIAVEIRRGGGRQEEEEKEKKEEEEKRLT